VRSAAVFVLLNALFYLLVFGRHSLLTIVLVLAALHLAASLLMVWVGTFVAKFQGGEWQGATGDRKPAQISEELVLAVARQAVRVANEGLSLFGQARSGQDAQHSMGLLSVLCVAAFVLDRLSLVTLLWLCVLVAFVWPVVYRQHHQLIDQQVAQINAQLLELRQLVVARVRSLLPKRQKRE
jgi:hypothetical protein